MRFQPGQARASHTDTADREWGACALPCVGRGCLCPHTRPGSRSRRGSGNEGGSSAGPAGLAPAFVPGRRPRGLAAEQGRKRRVAKFPVRQCGPRCHEPDPGPGGCGACDAPAHTYPRARRNTRRYGSGSSSPAPHRGPDPHTSPRTIHISERVRAPGPALRLEAPPGAQRPASSRKQSPGPALPNNPDVHARASRGDLLRPGSAPSRAPPQRPAPGRTRPALSACLRTSSLQ